MSAHGKYLSVLKVPAVAGDLELQIKTKTETLTISVALDPDGDEEENAELIKNQINATADANDMLYVGIPWFAAIDSTKPPFTIRAIATKHIVNVFSQSPFSMKITNAGGSQSYAADFPVYSTIADADDLIASGMATYSGWGTMSDAAKGTVLITSSSMLVALCGFDMIRSQYLYEHRGRLTNGFHLGFYPVQDWDEFVSPDIFLSELSLIGQDVQMLVEKDGNVTFDSRTATYKLRLDSVGKMTFEAGLDDVPPALLIECLRMTKYVKKPLGVSKLKTGSTSAEYESDKDFQNGVVTKLRGLFNG